MAKAKDILKPLCELGERETFIYRGKRFTKKTFWEAVKKEHDQQRNDELSREDTFFWFKVLTEDNNAANGGQGAWNVPRMLKGKQVPSVPMPFLGEISACRQGYHLTTACGIFNWVTNSRKIYLADFPPHAKADYRSDSKVAVDTARLVRYVGQFNACSGNKMVEFTIWPEKFTGSEYSAPMHLIDTLRIATDPKTLRAHAKKMESGRLRYAKQVKILKAKREKELLAIHEATATLRAAQRKFVVFEMSKSYVEWRPRVMNVPFMNHIGLGGELAVGGSHMLMNVGLYYIDKVWQGSLPRPKGTPDNVPDLLKGKVADLLTRAAIIRDKAVAHKWSDDVLKQHLEVAAM